ncbi:MAG: 4-alpha-L-fucosyltransferase (Fuc4NAc transferase) [Phormidium sp. OSCR]|nr:MAG: 4-alpha-L-fucosyltransferase (Fuc4NAc transferase) [Phormidium sp. OSCR]
MFLHIVIDSYYSLETAKILKEIKNSSSHIFIMMRGSGSSNQYSILEELKEEVLAISPDHPQFYARFTDEWLRRFDKIFIHGMYHSSLIHALLNKTDPSTFDRIYFIPYDGDVQLAIKYIENGSSDHPQVVALQKIKNWVVPPKYREIRSKFFKNFQSEWCNFYELHPIVAQPLQPQNTRELEIFVKQKFSQTVTPFRIMIGHSCSTNNNHISTLKQIAPLAQYDVQLVLPMAYHVDSAYRRKVYELGKSIFGDKVCLWDEYLSPKEYAQKLRDIDAAVFNLTQTSGFGVISYLIMCGSRVYLNRENLQSSDFRTLIHKGCNILEYEDLKKSPFSLLAPISELSALTNFDTVSNCTYSKKELTLNWQKLLS